MDVFSIVLLLSILIGFSFNNVLSLIKRNFKKIKLNNLKKIQFDKIHIYVSVVLFILCLFFPACYVGQKMEIQHSYELLIAGFFGIFVGAFAGYANPLFLFALINSNKPKSILFSAIALALALTFISYKRVMRVDFDFQPDITSLGWGYFLWVMSIAIFCVGQIFRFLSLPSFLVIASIAIPISIGSYFFNEHYYQRDNSKYNFQLEKDSIFKKECETAGTVIYAKTENVDGIFMSGNLTGYRKTFIGWEQTQYGASMEGIVNAGYFSFGETINTKYYKIGKKPEAAFTRYKKLSGYIETNELMSDIYVATQYIDYPRHINFVVAKTIIFDKKNNRKLAELKSLYDRTDKRFCGADGENEYSPWGIMVNILQLQVKPDSKW